MSILILGPSKSGTTALFYAILHKQAHLRTSFEPPDLTKIERHRPLLVKKLTDKLRLNELACCFHFNKRLFLIRDPRDRLISYLLYNIWDRRFIYDPDKRQRFIDLVTLKETHPGAISVKELMTCCGDLDGLPLLDSYLRTTNRILEIWRQLSNRFFLIKYEDFVDHRLSDLSAHLGFTIDNDPAIDNLNVRVARSKRYDNFKSWFLKEDCDFFNEAFADQLHAFGYQVQFPLPEAPTIDPRTSSGYLYKLIEMKLGSRVDRESK